MPEEQANGQLQLPSSSLLGSRWTGTVRRAERRLASWRCVLDGIQQGRPAGVALPVPLHAVPFLGASAAEAIGISAATQPGSSHLSLLNPHPKDRREILHARLGGVLAIGLASRSHPPPKFGLRLITRFRPRAPVRSCPRAISPPRGATDRKKTLTLVGFALPSSLFATPWPSDRLNPW